MKRKQDESYAEENGHPLPPPLFWAPDKCRTSQRLRTKGQRQIGEMYL